MAARKIQVEIVGDASSLERAFGKAEKKSGDFGGALKKAAIPAAVALAGLGVAAVKSTSAAVDLGEQISKTGVVFGKSAPEIHAWAKTTASAIGISNRAALEAAGTFGNMLVPMGFARDKAADMSKSMVNLAADMASFNNASPEETLDALRAGLAGETEPLRRFGVFLNDARLKQEAVSMGLYDGKGALDANAKAQATYAVILKDTADTQGDFGRTSDSLANRQRVLRAQLENVAASIGAALIPVGEKLATTLGGLIKFTGEHAELTKVLAGIIGGLAFSIVAANVGMKAYEASQVIVIAATKSWRAAQWLLNTALAANPIGLIIVGLVALGIALVVAYKKSETFRRIVSGALDGAKVAVESMVDAFIAVKDWISANWEEVATLISGPFALPVALATDAFGVRSTLTTAFTNIKNDVSTAVTAVAGFITALPAKIGDFSKTLLSTFTKFFTSAGIGGWVSGKVKEFADFVTGIPGRIADFGANLAERFKHFFTGAQIGAWLVEKVGEFAGKFSDLPGKIGNAIGDAMHFLKEKLGTLFSWKKIVGWIKDALGFGSPSPFFMAIGGDIVDSMARGVGAAAGVLKNAVIDLAKKFVPSAVQATIGAVGQVISPGGLPSGNTLDLLQLFARSQGIAITSAMREGPKEASFHNVGRAIDVSGSAGQMRDFFRAAISHFGVSNIAELFYDPMGYYVDNNRSPLGPPGGGRMYRGAIGGHSDHVHLALARGGIVTAPTMALIGERGPEAVIPLNRGGIAPIVNVYVAGSVMTERDLTTSIRDELVRMGKRNGGGMLGGLG